MSWFSFQTFLVLLEKEFELNRLFTWIKVYKLKVFKHSRGIIFFTHICMEK